MTNQGAFHNITLKPADTSQPGWYQAMMTCTENGDSGYESFYYKVTTTGDENPMTTFIIIGAVFIIFLITGYATKNEYIVFISGMVALITGIYSMIYGFNSAPNQFTYMISAVIVGIGMIFTLMPAYQLLENDGSTGMEEMEEVTID